MNPEVRRIQRRNPPIQPSAATSSPSGDAQPEAAPANPAATVDGPPLDGAPGKPRATKVVVGTEGERTVKRGTHAGDRTIRIVRPRLPGFRALEPGVIR